MFRNGRKLLCHILPWFPTNSTLRMFLTPLSRSKTKGRKRNSFVVFEDDVISEPAHSQFSASLSTLETISGDVRASNVTLEERIMLNGQVRGGQNTAGVSVLQIPQKYVIEDFQTFQARNKGKPQFTR